MTSPEAKRSRSGCYLFEASYPHIEHETTDVVLFVDERVGLEADDRLPDVVFHIGECLERKVGSCPCVREDLVFDLTHGQYTGASCCSR